MKRNKSCIEMHYYLDLPVGKTTMKRNIICLEINNTDLSIHRPAYNEV